MRSSDRLTAAEALARYAGIRDCLPAARFPQATRRVAHLGDLADEIDVFVLDGYGVLNVGTDAVPGAADRVAGLREAGKRLFVLTNGATYPEAQTVERYRRLGFDFAPEEVISSRMALARRLAEWAEPLWGFAATPDSAIESLAPRRVLLGDDPAPYAESEGFVLLSTGDWSRARQERLVEALSGRPRPVLVGNPDLVAPREDGLSPEPGLYAHEIRDRTGIRPEFYGKPFGNVFDLVRERLRDTVPAHRIAMVGDTPYTDILGGAAAGWRTVLVLAHGLLQGMSPDAAEAIAGLRPDFLAATT